MTRSMKITEDVRASECHLTAKGMSIIFFGSLAIAAAMIYLYFLPDFHLKMALRSAYMAALKAGDSAAVLAARANDFSGLTRYDPGIADQIMRIQTPHADGWVMIPIVASLAICGAFMTFRGKVIVGVALFFFVGSC